MRTYLREAEVTYRRATKLPESARGVVRSSRDVAPIVQELIGRRMTESFLVLALSAKNEIIGFHEVSRGSMTACPVAAVDVFRYPIIAGASAIIVSHNHPSGRVEPSQEDIVLTRRLREAADLLGIQLLDHIIVGGEAYTSFLDARLMGPTG